MCVMTIFIPARADGFLFDMEGDCGRVMRGLVHPCGVLSRDVFR